MMKPRDPSWKIMHRIRRSGAAGAHQPRKYTRKVKHKHKENNHD